MCCVEFSTLFKLRVLGGVGFDQLLVGVLLLLGALEGGFLPDAGEGVLAGGFQLLIVLEGVLADTRHVLHDGQARRGFVIRA